MAPDVQRPIDDPYALVGGNWPTESESAYHTAETNADALSTTARTQAESADDAAGKTDSQMRGKTADSVSDGYSRAAKQLNEQGQTYTTISGWMLEASAKVRTAKNRMAALVRSGTSEIKEALNSELAGTPVTPSSTALTDKYRGEIGAVATTLAADLDGIGHSLVGDPGSSTTPTYVRAAQSSTTPTVEQTAVHHALTREGPHAEPHQLPEMPRATTTQGAESPSTPVTPSAPNAPVAPHPTLSNLVAGSSPLGTPASPSAKSASSATPLGTPAGQAHQPTETHQNAKSAGLPRIPSITLPDLPAAAADITTAVSSATAHQLPTASTAPTTPGSSIPASMGITPGTSGTAPVPSAPPAGLAPVGGLPTPPVVQAAPVAQATPAAPPPAGPAPSPQAPAPAAPRGPVVDAAWLQRTYGLSPGLDLPKFENSATPALFIADLPELEAYLHRALASIRHQFEAAGWSQPIAVATIRRGFETKTVYVTSDALSIHPHGVLLPSEVLPLDEIPGTPSHSRLAGSLMVSEKLTRLIPREWTVESLLSTVSGGEASQSTEQYQQLMGAGELFPCTVSRGRDDVGADEALRVFARAAIGSAGCGELDVESARLRAARWVGVQPQGYLDVLSRFYLSDAAEAMSLGRWSEAVYSAGKYMSIRDTEKQVA